MSWTNPYISWQVAQKQVWSPHSVLFIFIYILNKTRNWCLHRVDSEIFLSSHSQFISDTHYIRKLQWFTSWRYPWRPLQAWSKNFVHVYKGAPFYTCIIFLITPVCMLSAGYHMMANRYDWYTHYALCIWVAYWTKTDILV